MHPLYRLRVKKDAPELIAAPLGFRHGESMLSSIKVLVIRSFNLSDAGF